VSGHIADQAAFIAALSREDPERIAAERHAQSCSACGEALSKGRALMTLLERAPVPPPPSAEVLTRVSRAIEGETERENGSSISPLLWAMAALAAWALELAIAKKLSHDPARVLVSAGWGLVAAMLAAWASVRARWAAAGAVVASLALIGVALGDDTQLYALLGIKCTVLELMAACIPYGIAVALARRTRTGFEAWQAAAIAAAGALAGHAALHLSCKVPHAGLHLLVFHFGGVLLAAVLGYGGSRAARSRLA
jgi:hypothetical protein